MSQQIHPGHNFPPASATKLSLADCGRECAAALTAWVFMKIAATMQLELHFHPPFPLLCCPALNCCLAGATGFRSPDPYLRREGVISPNDDAGCYTAIIIIIILATTTTPTPYRHPSFHPHPPLGAYNKRQNLFTFITIIPCSFFANDDDRTPPWICCTLVDVVAAAPDDDATVAAFAGCWVQ